MEEAPNTMALGAVATGNIKAYEDVTAAKKVNKTIIITKCKQIAEYKCKQTCCHDQIQWVLTNGHRQISQNRQEYIRSCCIGSHL